MELTTDAFVLHKEEKGEDDAILTLYTKELGKIRCRARSYRKLASKLRPALLLFSRSHITLHRGNAGWLVVGADAADRYFAISKNPTALHLGLIVIDVLNELVTDEERDEQLFHTVDSFFTTFSRAAQEDSAPDLFAASLSFLAVFSKLNGIAPEISHCAVCDSKENLSCFSYSSGGTVCRACATPIRGVQAVAPETIDVLTQAYRGDIKTIATESLTQALLILVGFLRWHAK